MNDDMWGTESGRATDYEGTIVDAWFEPAGQYAASLNLKFATDLEAQPEVTERYSLGPDWTTVDQGESVVHPSKTKFNQNSQAGRLVDKVASLAGDVVRGRGTPPTQAATWLGLRFFMEEVTNSGTFRAGEQAGQEWKSTKNYPSKFFGIDDQALLDRENGAGTGGGAWYDGLDIDAQNRIVALAKGLTHGEWMDKVLEVDGVLGNDKLVGLLTDDSPDGLYERLKSSD